MQMNPDPLPKLTLPAHTCSSLLLPGGLISRTGANSGLTQHAAGTSGWEGVPLSLCHFCACSTFGHIQSTSTFIFDFPPGCLPAPAHTTEFEMSSWSQGGGTTAKLLG